jgi:CRP-like cAMP-binding protein
MSIEQTDVVDFISVNEATDEVVLTISDHLEWESDTKEHLLLLQEKINSYLRFIESGELLESYPNANGRNAVIKIVSKYSLNEEAKEFIDQVKLIVSNAGMALRFEQFKEA